MPYAMSFLIANSRHSQRTSQRLQIDFAWEISFDWQLGSAKKISLPWFPQAASSCHEMSVNRSWFIISVRRSLYFGLVTLVFPVLFALLCVHAVVCLGYVALAGTVDYLLPRPISQGFHHRAAVVTHTIRALLRGMGHCLHQILVLPRP